MTLLRLEVLRVLRTRRWLLTVGVYASFGLVGPLLARYLDALVERFGGGEVTVTAGAPRPVDGIGQFVGNASQLGLLAVIVVAAGALALDARPEVAAFLRTRVRHAGQLLLPRFGVAAATAAVSLAAGTAVAWATTAALLGALPAGPMLLGTALGAVYLVFAVAVVAAAATVTRAVATTVFASLAVLLALPVVALVGPLRPWLPSELLAAVLGLLDGEPAGDYARATLVAVVASAGLVALAARRADRREL